ncbi:PAS domain-containing sensor histidine kinase [Noviherbaspirillum suwonense]|nr:ATP-binding protein [Noviherbaspirillum suwonense]
MATDKAGLGSDHTWLSGELSTMRNGGTGAMRHYRAGAIACALLATLVGLFWLAASLTFIPVSQGDWSIAVSLGVLLSGASLGMRCLPAHGHPASRAGAGIAAAAALVLGLLILLDSMPALAPGLLPAAWSAHPLLGFDFVFAGAALLLHDSHTRGRHYPSEYLAAALAGLNAVPLLSALYGIDLLQGLADAAPVAPSAALAMFAVGLGLLLARPTHTLMTVLTSNAPGARMLRHTLPQILVLLVVLNWLLDIGALRGLYPETMLAPLQTLANAVLMLLIFWRAARMVNLEYEARLQTAADLSEAMSLLVAVSDNTADPIFVQNRDGLLVFANPATLAMLGKTREQALHRPARELFAGVGDIGDIEQSEQADSRVMAEKVSVTVEHSLRLPQGTSTYATTRSPWVGPDGAVLGVIAISTDISRRKEAEDALRARELRLEETVSRRTATLRRLADHLETVREEEKRAIARELHDDMGASLTSLAMHMEGAYPLLPSDPQWTGRKAKIQTLLRSLVTTTRRIQTELRPTMLDLFGIKAAIHELTDDFRQRSNIACEVSLPDEDIAIGHKLEITVYRMLQEMLNNVVKHAQASHVDVILDVDEDHVALTVRDDGVGMPPERQDTPATYGLRGLKERAAFLGGAVTVSAGRNGGTVVSVQLPLAHDEQDPGSL